MGAVREASPEELKPWLGQEASKGRRGKGQCPGRRNHMVSGTILVSRKKY